MNTHDYGEMRALAASEGFDTPEEHAAYTRRTKLRKYAQMHDEYFYDDQHQHDDEHSPEHDDEA